MISKILSIISFPLIWVGAYISKILEDVSNLINIKKHETSYSFGTNLIILIITLLFDCVFGMFLAILVPIYVIQEVFNNNVYFEEAIKRAYFRFSRKKRRESHKVKDDNVIDLDVE